MHDERAGGRTRTGSDGIKGPGPVPSGATSDWSARLVSNEAFRCIRAASSPADSGPWCIGGHRAFRKPDLRPVVPALYR